MYLDDSVFSIFISFPSREQQKDDLINVIPRPKKEINFLHMTNHILSKKTKCFRDYKTSQERDIKSVMFMEEEKDISFCLLLFLYKGSGQNYYTQTGPSKPQNVWWSLPTYTPLSQPQKMVSLLHSHPSIQQ